MRPIQLLASALAFSTLAAAWPEPIDVPALQSVKDRRQDTTPNEKPTATTPSKATLPAKTDATVTGDASEPTAGPTKTTNQSKGTGTESETAEVTGPIETEYPPGDAPGQVVMVNPAPTAVTSFYKIGDHVTFQWNYTALQQTPSYIDVIATCANALCPTHTIAANQSAQQTQVVWDTKAYQENAPQKLDTRRYTLVIYDAASQITAAPKPGYLMAFRQFSFGMYIPKPAVAFNDFTCPACSAASSSAKSQTLTVLIGMASVTVFSFSWFAGSFGLF